MELKKTFGPACIAVQNSFYKACALGARLPSDFGSTISNNAGHAGSAFETIKTLAPFIFSQNHSPIQKRAFV